MQLRGELFKGRLQFADQFWRVRAHAFAAVLNDWKSRSAH
jgi:hypothetical protein